MEELVCIVPAAGKGERLGLGYNKAFALLAGLPVLVRTLEAVASAGLVKEAVVTLGAGELEEGKKLLDRYKKEHFPELAVKLVQGGATRTASVAAALAAIKEDAPYVAVHDGARPLVEPEIFLRTFSAATRFGAAVAAVPVKDTVKVTDDEALVLSTPPRATLMAVQTPQIFRRELLLEAYERAVENKTEATDDASLVEAIGGKVACVPGSEKNIKITTPNDLLLARLFLEREEKKMYRIGSGFDVHRLTKGRKLILCGVEVPYELGLLGHSDADVALHALTDALLGAAALGDIGKYFPDTDERFKGADSRELTKEAVRMLRLKGYAIENADITIIAQRPKLAPFIEKMRQTTAAALGIEAEAVSVKATTTEALGFTGRGEGIAAQATVLLSREFKRK